MEGGIVPATQAGTTVAPNCRPVVPHSLMPFLIEPRHLKRAARECMRRASAPGADGQSWASFRYGLDERLDDLSEQLRSGIWRPGPLKLSHVVAYTGKRIETVIPTVSDRVVHRAMRRAIEPVLELRVFAPWVSGFRRGRNRLTAVRQAAEHLGQGRTWTADIDVQQASAGATTAEVIDWLADALHDGTFLARVRTALNALPDPIVPGCGLSPLLINLRLSRVDAQLRGLSPVRFADNYCLFASSRAAAESAYATAARALSEVGLRPHPGKSRIRPSAHAEDLFLISG
ncbi:reverse transcriptase domain-containing protein [Streptomyces sp. G7(2002)]|uniref:reverse transcriptase domain-containing protein n=1 Tax=Streptomyces sp. G7(2002) TaxID=2971798 RepID=UPI00237ED90D|nr:reverse transcriptase domain-containing protein [Streptomyces sp. G7(2002)]WDT53522.1 reverse transcriptase domain-containing protein [Streptomyces sp. G7(2002)]